MRLLSRLFGHRAITRIALDPPAADPGRAGLALVAITRNEADHIAEWGRFHIAAGVGQIYLYDNGSRDGTAEILRAAIGPARLTVIPWDQRLRDGRSGAEIHNQVLAYAHATRNFGGRWRWMSYIDIDEFLVPKTGGDLLDALAPLASQRAISLPWHMFGRGGHSTPPAGGVLRNYTLRHPDPMSAAKGLRNFKMIVDPCHVTALRVHQIWVDGVSDSCNDAGRLASAQGRHSPDFYSAARIQLNHYYTRSDAELRAKIARGPNLTTPDADHLRRVMRKVEAIEADQIEDRAAADWWGKMDG